MNLTHESAYAGKSKLFKQIIPKTPTRELHFTESSEETKDYNSDSEIPRKPFMDSTSPTEEMLQPTTPSGPDHVNALLLCLPRRD
jgi:hypothetical protein